MHKKLESLVAKLHATFTTHILLGIIGALRAPSHCDLWVCEARKFEGKKKPRRLGPGLTWMTQTHLEYNQSWAVPRSGWQIVRLLTAGGAG